MFGGSKKKSGERRKVRLIQNGRKKRRKFFEEREMEVERIGRMVEEGGSYVGGNRKERKKNTGEGEMG